jgi:hypothetical protein
MTHGTRLAPALEKNPQHHGSSQHGLEKLGHLWHQRGFVNRLGLGTSKAPMQIS